MWSPNPLASGGAAADDDHLLPAASGGSVRQHPVTIADEKKRRKRQKDTVKSLRKKKKTPALRQLLDSFPRRIDRKPEAAASDNRKWTDDVKQPPARDAESDTDSWCQIEERFHEIYEPLPGHVMTAPGDSWRSVTKDHYVSRTEILQQIQSLRAEESSRKRPEASKNCTGSGSSSNRTETSKKRPESSKTRTESSKNRSGSSKNCTGPGTSTNSTGPGKNHVRKVKVDGRVDPGATGKDFSGHTYENVPVVAPVLYQGPSLAEIYQAKMEIRRKQQVQQLTGHQFHYSGSGSGVKSHVTRALIHARPQHLSSDSESTLIRFKPEPKPSIATGNRPQTGNKRLDLMETFRKRRDSLGASDLSSSSSFSSSSSGSTGSSSSCDGCCSGCDDCSSCSCSSCDSTTTVRRRATVLPPEVVEITALNYVQQRRMEIEKIQEMRLKDFVRKQQQQLPSAVRKDRWTPKSSPDVIYEPIPVSSLMKNTLTGSVGKSRPVEEEAKERKRKRIVAQLKEQMKRNLEAEVDPEARRKRHDQLKDLLSDTLHAGSRTLSNINVGLIYVPMEETEEGESSSSLENVEDFTETAAEVADADSSGSAPEDDAFGSIDTLIFEPRNPSPEEVEALQNNVSEQFDYLNDPEYASEPEQEVEADDEEDSETDSKNGMKAAAVAQPEEEEETTISSGAAAASSNVSASESSLTGSRKRDTCDTDASWDYMDAHLLPDDDAATDLLIGNLRKRPVQRLGDEPEEAEEAVRMLESLRVADESHQSSSIRLLFPSVRTASGRKRISFLELANLSANPEAADDGEQGFRSLPEWSAARPEAEKKVSGSERKRNSVIRELKVKLRDKFRLLPATSGNEPEVDSVTYGVPCGALQSTGYPHHLWPRLLAQPEPEMNSGSEPTTIYDPSLPDDVPHYPYDDYHHRSGYPLDVYDLLPAADDPEVGSWRIQEPLLEEHEWLFWHQLMRIEQDRQRQMFLWQQQQQQHDDPVVFERPFWCPVDPFHLN